MANKKLEVLSEDVRAACQVIYEGLSDDKLEVLRTLKARAITNEELGADVDCTGFSCRGCPVDDYEQLDCGDALYNLVCYEHYLMQPRKLGAVPMMVHPAGRMHKIKGLIIERLSRDEELPTLLVREYAFLRFLVTQRHKAQTEGMELSV